MTDDIIVFDIETRLHNDRFDQTVRPFKRERPVLADFNPADVKLGNLKDEGKIADKIALARKKHQEDHEVATDKWEAEFDEHFAKQADKAALYPGQSEICAIGWQVPGEEPVTLMLGDDGIETEVDLVRPFIALFREVTESPLTAGGNFRFGFYSGNSKRDSYFDVVHLREAVRRLGIRINMAFLSNPGQPRSPWVDLAMEYFQSGAILPQCDGYPSYLSLEDAASHATGTRQNKPDGVTGAEFGEAMEDPEQREECRKYLAQDLLLTRLLADNSLLNLVD